MGALTVEPFPGVEVPAAWWERVGARLTYDQAEADRAVRFYPKFCRHWEAEWGGRPFHLDQWQERRIVRPVFGLMREDGLRAIRRCFVEIPRKNGKSLLASGTGNKLLFADREPGAKVVSAAGDRKQAGQVYDAAALSVEHSPELAARSRIFRGNDKRIVVPRTGSEFRVVSSDGRRSHGGNLHGILVDELHVWKGHYQGSLLEALLTSTGSRRQPLAFVITTAGYDRDSICFEEYTRACFVRDGVLPRADYLPVIYEADPADDWHDPEVWRRANPGLGVSKKLDYMETQHAEALEAPAKLNTFKRLDLNIWTDQATAWIPSEAWRACADPALTFPAGRPCGAAFDLSTRSDTTALVLAWELPSGRVGVWAHAFVPEGALERDLDGALVREWEAAGHCTVTAGKAVDFGAILELLAEWSERATILRVGYDPWNAEFFRQKVEERLGLETVEFRQGWPSMGEPCATFQRLWSTGRLVHSGDPMLAYQAACSAVLEDPAGNIKPAKNKSRGRIDEVVAAIMAVWLLLGGEGVLSAEDIVG